MLRYYHQLAQNGQSPFDAPRFVVAYQPEALLGDQAFFQCDILPEHDTVSCDYVVSFRLANQDGQTVTTLASRVTTGRENDDPFLEVRMDTSELAGKTEVLVPYVTVRQIDHVSGEWRTLYSDVRLAPVRLRHNNLRFARPMIIALDRVASDEEVTLAVKPQSPRSAVVTAATTGKSPLKRLVLAESLLSAGSFRDDDTVAGVPPGQTRLFVRIDIDARTHCRLSVEGGTINERYTPYWRADLCRTVGPVSSLEYDSQQNWGAPWNVFRITGRPDAKITLALDVKGAPQSVATTLAGVIAGNVRQTATLSGKRILVTFVDTTGTTEANLDYPLPPAGSYRRTIPLSEYGEQVHVYHAYALTADGKIAFSLPVVVDTAPKSGRQTVQFVDSQGTYDDFVNDHAEESRSPYGPADLRTVSLPVGDVPYFRLSLDEGVGIALNDAAIGHQFGQAWIQGSTAGRTPGEAAGSGAVSPNEAPYEWLTDGWRGGALRLGESGVIRIRSTSWPYGALTVSARLRAGAANTSGSASTFSIGPLTARLDSGKIDVKQRFTWLEASGAARLLPGWNHVAFVNDLSVLRVYVNGDLVAASAPATPVLQRTHWVPEIRITPIGGTTPLLDGGIDQVEVIGCALDAAGVRAVYSKGRWK